MSCQSRLNTTQGSFQVEKSRQERKAMLVRERQERSRNKTQPTATSTKHGGGGKGTLERWLRGKRTSCPSRGPEFSFQHPCQGLTTSSNSSFSGSNATDLCTHTSTHKYIQSKDDREGHKSETVRSLQKLGATLRRKGNGNPNHTPIGAQFSPQT